MALSQNIGSLKRQPLVVQEHTTELCVSGDPKVPVLYQVERTRDGRSFCVRSVKAIQHGQPILICQASFHMQQPSPLEHQFSMPSVPPPDTLLTIEELIQRYLRSQPKQRLGHGALF